MERKVVFDIGSLYSSIGYSNAEAPRSRFPTLVGRPKNPGIMVGMWNSDYFVGDNAQSKRGILKLTYPMRKGCFVDQDESEDLQFLVEYAFNNELRIPTIDSTVMLSLRLKTIRNIQGLEMFLELMFEKCSCGGIGIENTCKLGLLSTGRITGTVLDSGHEVSESCSFIDGNLIINSYFQEDYGGSQVSETFRNIFNSRMYRKMTTTAEKEIITDLKHKCGFFKVQDIEMPKYPFGYELPRGAVWEIDQERYESCEFLMNSSLFPKVNEFLDEPHIIQPENSLPELVFESIQKSPKDERLKLYRNIICVGGNSMIKYFPDRLKEEIGKIGPFRNDLKIICKSNRKYGPWIGGNVLSNLSSFQDILITKEEYNELGTKQAIIKKVKCILI